jgi:hypothetical protein
LLQIYESELKASGSPPGNPGRRNRIEMLIHIDEVSARFDAEIQPLNDSAAFSSHHLISIIKLDSIHANEGLIVA